LAIAGSILCMVESRIESVPHKSALTGSDTGRHSRRWHPAPGSFTFQTTMSGRPATCLDPDQLENREVQADASQYAGRMHTSQGVSRALTDSPNCSKDPAQQFPLLFVSYILTRLFWDVIHHNYERDCSNSATKTRQVVMTLILLRQRALPLHRLRSK
jgi:hypothetical protein